MQINSINYLRIYTNVIQVEKMKIDDIDHIEGLGNGEREREACSQETRGKFELYLLYFNFLELRW